MSPRIEVVQRVEDDVEGLEPRDIESRIFDVVVVCFNLDIGIELASRLFRDLSHNQRMFIHRVHMADMHLLMPWTF
jgi:hypothetical protein